MAPSEKEHWKRLEVLLENINITFLRRFYFPDTDKSINRFKVISRFDGDLLTMGVLAVGAENINLNKGSPSRNPSHQRSILSPHSPPVHISTVNSAC